MTPLRRRKVRTRSGEWLGSDAGDYPKPSAPDHEEHPITDVEGVERSQVAG
jgi:hypothetical protein